jgi:hypothetical protein
MAADTLFEHLDARLQSIFVGLLNQDPLALTKATHRLGGIALESRQAEIIRGKRSLERGGQLEVAKNEEAVARLASKSQPRKNLVQMFASLAENCRRQSIRFLRAKISPSFVKCAKCGRYSLAENGRGGRRYCSKKTGRNCGSNVTARARVYEKRAAERDQQLRMVRSTMRTWNGTGDWKTWTAKRSGVTANWITYAVNRGDLKAPN